MVIRITARIVELILAPKADSWEGLYLLDTEPIPSGFFACISSRITAGIQITVDNRINYNCFNEPFAVSPCEDLY